MGAAAAFSQWPVAIALSVIGFATLRLVRRATPKGASTDRGDLLDGTAPPAGPEARTARRDE